MDWSTVIATVVTAITTIGGGYLAFRSKMIDLQHKTKEDSLIAVKAANDMLFNQFTLELDRRDKRIESLESKIEILEQTRTEQQAEIAKEREQNQELIFQLQREQEKRVEIENDFKGLCARVEELERENKELRLTISSWKNGHNGI